MLIFLLACADKGTPADTTVPTDTADTADTSPIDSGTVAEDAIITGTLILPEDTTFPGAVTVGLVHLRFGWAPSVEGTLVSTTLTAPGEFTLELPPTALSSSLYPVARDYPDLDGATHLLIAFEDTDGDGAFSEGEPLLGAPLGQLFVYLDGEVPAQWSAGWSVMDVGLEGTYESGNCLLDTDDPLTWRDYAGYPEVRSFADPVDLPLPGLPATLTLSGSAADGRLAVLPYQTISYGKSYAPLADVPVSAGTFTLTLSTPPDEALYLTTDPTWNYALGVPLRYEDTDSSGDYSTADTLTEGVTCIGDEEALARYTKPVFAYRDWRLMECYGANAGWRAVTRDSDGGWKDFRSSDEAAATTVDPTICSW